MSAVVAVVTPVILASCALGLWRLLKATSR